MLVTHKAIGILGGTFDPIHFGHLRMALELYELLTPTQIKFLPSYQPMHRPSPLVSAEHRLAMLKQALPQDLPFVADDREIKRRGPTYTLDTLLELRKELPGTPLCLFLGLDVFLSLNEWKQWEDILGYSHLIVAYRPPWKIPDQGVIAELLKKHVQQDINYFHTQLAGGILLHPAMTALDISSSQIRALIHSGKDPRYLLPDAVYCYIKQHQLYMETV